MNMIIMIAIIFICLLVFKNSKTGSALLFALVLFLSGCSSTTRLHLGKAHIYDEGVITIAPTCTEEGEMTYTCTECGKTYTETIPASGHQWDEGIEAEEIYILNKNPDRMRIHANNEDQSCVKQIHIDNKDKVTDTISSLEARGYTKCQKCVDEGYLKEKIIYTCTECGETKIKVKE